MINDRGHEDMLELIQDVLSRQWHDLVARPSGPMSFRFLLQPAMATLLAIRHGLKDARVGRIPFLQTIVTNPELRWPRIRAGLRATSHIILLGIVMDAIYQFIAFRKFYPVEALIVAVVLACVPYFLIRGTAERIARSLHKDRGPGSASQP